MRDTKRSDLLEANPEEWFKYYLPNYYTAEAADFHKESTMRVIGNPAWSEVRLWGRDLATDTRIMMEVLYLLCTKKKNQVLIVSSTMELAELKAKQYRTQLKKNKRLIEDYQTNTISEYVIFSIGEGQMLTGIDIHVDILLFLDCDTDENCSKPHYIDQRWEWVNKWIFSKTAKELLVIWGGVAHAKNCCILRAGEIADEVDVRNITDAEGLSSWPQKNSAKAIQRLLSTISHRTAEIEYFNKYVWD